MFIELSTFLPGYPAPSNFNHETWVAQDNKITRAEVEEACHRYIHYYDAPCQLAQLAPQEYEMVGPGKSRRLKA
jgi:hypothetical protein